VDDIHKSIRSQINKEHSRKGYCIVRDVISAAATVLQQSAAWKGT